MSFLTKSRFSQFYSRKCPFLDSDPDSGMSDVQDLAILAIPGHPDQFWPDSRLGPPELARMARMAGKCQNRPFWHFLRGTRAILRGGIL